ncbi:MULTISPECIES: hypothetical protein [Clostridia]|uniref:hypothetical protein n=1 Tax=Clostridia TaxID=186801 RepID=UPI000E46C710|nr:MULTISPECIES: hypothetical protein [Clostridia]RHV71038.1 hypothetical protein DXB15_03770 [Roseburia sp. OM02-15]
MIAKKDGIKEMLSIIHGGYVQEMITLVIENEDGYRYMPVDGVIEKAGDLAYFKISETSYPPEIKNGTATAELRNAVFSDVQLSEYMEGMKYSAFLVNYGDSYYILAEGYIDSEQSNDVLFQDYLEKTQKYNVKKLHKKLENIKYEKQLFSDALDSAASFTSGQKIKSNGKEMELDQAIKMLKGYGLTSHGAKKMLSDLQKKGVKVSNPKDYMSQE